MPKLGKGKIQTNAQLTEAQAAYLNQRAKRLEWSLRKVVSRILAMYFEAGCPPLSEPDAKMPKLHFSEVETHEVEEEITHTKRV